jgi:hypothetical protein
VAGVGVMRVACGILSGNLKVRDHSENLVVNGRMRLDSSGSGWGLVAFSCEHGGELSGYVGDG